MTGERYRTMDSDALSPGMLGTIRNALRLMELLTVGPAYQHLNELAERSGLTPPTVHRLLRSLTVGGLVTQHPDSLRYSLGPELVRLSHQYLMRQPVVQALSPYLVELRKATKATIQLALLVHGSVVYVDRVDGEHASGLYRVSHRVHPALDTAAGRVLLARAGLEVWKEVLERPSSNGLTPDGCYPDNLTQEAWAQAPYLVLSDPFFPDSVEVAVPVTDRHGRALASLSATDHNERFTATTVTERIVPHLLRATDAVRETITRG